MKAKPVTSPEYRRPTGAWIGRCEETEHLYDLEEKRNKAFKAAAKELQKVLGFEHFWHEALPEALLSFLEGWDQSAAQLAAQVYLEQQNERAYTKKDQRHLVLKCDLDRLQASIASIDRLFESNQWENLDYAKREAITWITNLIKTQKGGQ